MAQEPFHPDEIAIPRPAPLPELALSEAGIHKLVEQASARQIPPFSDALVRTALAAHAERAARVDLDWRLSQACKALAESERKREKAERQLLDIPALSAVLKKAEEELAEALAGLAKVEA